MPGVGSVQVNATTAAISRAAARTGVDFDYLIAQARIESGLDPKAQARTSSARGLYQFIDSTWVRTIDRHGAKHGLGWAGDAVNGGRFVDPSLRAEVLALRDDPDVSALMAAELALDNRDGLRATLGREPDHSELYLAHFLGLKGAQDFLGALATHPDAAADRINPAAARANRGIFYEGGQARSVAGVMDAIRGKMGTASAENAGSPAVVAGTSEFMRLRQQFQPTSGMAAGATYQEPIARPSSMAETLRATFGNGHELGERTGSRIAAAYDKFRTFAL